MPVGVVDLLEIIDIQQNPCDMHSSPGLSGDLIHVVHEVIAVIQAGQGVQVGVLALQADVQKGETQGHRHPDQGDAVAEQLNDASQIHGDQEGEHRHEDIFVRLSPIPVGQHSPVGDVAVHHRAGQQEQGGAVVDVILCDPEKYAEELIAHGGQTDEDGGNGCKGIVLFQTDMILKQPVIHIADPEEGENGRQAQVQDTAQNRQLTGAGKQPLFQQEARRFRCAEDSTEQAHDVKEFSIDGGHSGSSVLAEQDGQHEADPKPVCHQDSGHVDLRKTVIFKHGSLLSPRINC